MRQPSAYQIEQAMAAAGTVISALVLDDPANADDHRLIADMIEGETDAVNVVRALIRYSIEAQSLADAAKERVEALRVRKDRFERRVETARSAALSMLEALNWRETLEEPDFTVSLKQAPSKILVTDPDDLDDEFVRIKREPNKTAIGKALDGGREVKGAVRSNGGTVLSVRTK